MVVELNGLELHTIQDAHREFARQTDLPTWYGCNLDALYDALTGMVERPLTIRWTNADESTRRFPEDMEAFEKVIEDIRLEEQSQASSWPPLIYQRFGGLS